MFQKILVANRGEIAVRVIRTLRELGITSVTVYSEADRRSLHVARADEAYLIGPAPSAESYLRIDRVIDAAVRSGAEAIHPGYGFLAENSAFARAVADAGLTFIGPSPEAMDMMGNKVAARRCMVEQGVPVIPGTGEPVSDAAEAGRQAEEIGYPVMLKAAAGGGGKGIRVIHEPAELESALEMTRSEAEKAFGDNTIFVEKYIESPRHIEVQIMGDHHGNIVYLGERECSVQRRFQKLIEEAPSAAVNEELRAHLGQTAVEAGRAVDYVGAGTVEFVMGQDKKFYFLEMNTRLQVEHPITEMITGIDLVRDQILVAAGEKLPHRQEDIRIHGHAIEFRVNAEDPAQGFLPSGGTISNMHLPQGPGVRNDAGFYAGYEVPTIYDPMLGKLIVWAENRELCIARSSRALHEYSIKGIRHNLAFHAWALQQQEFISGNYDTHFIDNAFKPDMLKPRGREEDLARIASVIRTYLDRDRMVITDGPTRTPWKWIGRREGIRGR